MVRSEIIPNYVTSLMDSLQRFKQIAMVTCVDDRKSFFNFNVLVNVIRVMW